MAASAHERVSFDLHLLGHVDRLGPQPLEPAAQLSHLGVAGDAHVEFGVAAEAGQGEVGGADDGRAGLGVVAVPAQVGLGVQHTLGVRLDFQAAGGDEVAQARHAGCGIVVLRQARHALADGARRLCAERRPRATPHQVVAVHPRLQRLGLLQPAGHLVERRFVGAADHHAYLIQPLQLRCDGIEARQKEVAHGDVGARRAGQHALEPLHEGRVGVCVQDVHNVVFLSIHAE